MKNNMQEFERLIGVANVRICEICGNKIPLEDHVLTYGEGTLRSGEREIARLDMSAPDGLQVARKTIWCLVDTVKDLVRNSSPKKAESKPNKARGIDDVMTAVEETVAAVNTRLKEATASAEVFSFEEVKMAVECDSAAIYVHSGTTPVAAVPRAGDPESVIRELKDLVLDMADATCAAVERRSGLKSAAENLKAESEKGDRAEEVLRAAGADASVVESPDPSAKAAVIDAAKKAVKKTNTNPFVGLVRHRDHGLSVETYRLGLVVKAGGKPCLVTRFPKISNNATIEKMVRYMEADISALAASRAAYYERLRRDADREAYFREVAELRDRADRMVAQA